MGFIASEINKEHDKYILLEDIVLLVQELDGDNPSLSDTAKFLLQKYEQRYGTYEDIPLGYVDDKCFINEVSGVYKQVSYKRPLFHFLKFVALYNCFDSGISENDPDFIVNNEYSDIYLKKNTVVSFLKNKCGLENFHGWQEFKQDSQTKGEQPANDGDTKEDAEQADRPYANTPQQKRAENMQAHIIAALACMYTKTDCSKPYEAAETILQEWQRQSDKLGKPPSRDTIGKYILQGIERFSN
ncbi:hypothetical protein ACTHSL_10290 [Neisseria sp. P0008.S010]|uniref:hypothetical protein n=1 Tax=Neisseria sp. P0008.S010 TaxID=3436707 RepID=UPI003F7FFD24